MLIFFTEDAVYEGRTCMGGEVGRARSHAKTGLALQLFEGPTLDNTNNVTVSFS